MFSYKFVNWLIFILLCLIWGSSFILMKLGLYDASGKTLLSAYQVATIRILSAGVVLAPVLLFNWLKTNWKIKGYMFLSGLLGNFFAAFLFCIAETKIDSALAGTLNALTPIFVIITGAIIYKQEVAKQKIVGVGVGLLGSIALLLTSRHHSLGDLNYVVLVILATIFYGININMVRQKLGGIPPTFIASFAFTSLIVPSAIILYYSGFFALPLNTAPFIKATAAACVLGVIGTAIAAILLYQLVKRAGGVFASLVAYGIPFVAILWSKWYGEDPNIGEILSLFIVLGGVYLANKPVKVVNK